MEFHRINYSSYPEVLAIRGFDCVRSGLKGVNVLSRVLKDESMLVEKTIITTAIVLFSKTAAAFFSMLSPLLPTQFIHFADLISELPQSFPPPPHQPRRRILPQRQVLGNISLV